MTTKYKTKGFVFKKDDKGESDRVFSVFTDDFGRLEIVGKAARKINSKLRSSLDLFYLSEIEFIQGKNQKTLTNAIAIKKIPADDNLFQISSILDNFIKGEEKDSQTFILLQEIFEKMHQHEMAHHYFAWNFLANQGYCPEVSECASCKDKLSPYCLYFSCREGGVICRGCSIKDKEALKINSDVVKILRIILKKDWQTVSKLKVELSSQKLFEKTLQMAVRSFCPI
jgi:DNA repair protein RecO (recombination protein O)